METFTIAVSFLSGGLAGAILNHIVANRKNKIQKLECCYIDDEIISKLPISFGSTKHDNLFSKTFTITNTTNRDIEKIKINFEFEPAAVITKWASYSKAGANIPKGKINTNKSNECEFIIKHFNRKEKIEVTLEIANITTEEFNVTELDITGIKIKYKDKRKAKAARPVKLVEKKELKNTANISYPPAGQTS